MKHRRYSKGRAACPECGGCCERCRDGNGRPTWDCNNCVNVFPRRTPKRRALITPSQQRVLDTLTKMGIDLRGLDQHQEPSAIFLTASKKDKTYGLSATLRINRAGVMACKTLWFTRPGSWTRGMAAWMEVRSL